MDELATLRERTGEVEATLSPAGRRWLTVGRVLDRALGSGLPFAVLLAMMILAMRSRPVPEAEILAAVAFGFVLAAARRPLVLCTYRAVLRQVGEGLHAVGGSTSVALPSFGAPPSAPVSPAPPPRFVEPVRPPPRVGDPDADDFED